MLTRKRPVIEKYEKLKLEHAHADALDESLKSVSFGFNCLHYSVSEGSKTLSIQILNKTREAGKVKVCTLDGDAKANEDYVPYNDIITFGKGEYTKNIEVGIIDDDQWEPDEDFFVQLYDANTQNAISGQDTKTRITIVDDDKPGQICFKELKSIKVSPTAEFAEVVISRKNGNDGIVEVDFETVQIGT